MYVALGVQSGRGLVVIVPKLRMLSITRSLPPNPPPQGHGDARAGDRASAEGERQTGGETGAAGGDGGEMRWDAMTLASSAHRQRTHNPIAPHVRFNFIPTTPPPPSPLPSQPTACDLRDHIAAQERTRRESLEASLSSRQEAALKAVHSQYAKVVSDLEAKTQTQLTQKDKEYQGVIAQVRGGRVKSGYREIARSARGTHRSMSSQLTSIDPFLSFQIRAEKTAVGVELRQTRDAAGAIARAAEVVG